MRPYKHNVPIQRPEPFRIKHSNRYEVGAAIWIFGFIAIVVILVVLLVLNYPG
jgi:hypothetical protein